MEEKKVIMIDEASFRDKTLEIIKDMADKGGPHLAIATILGFAKLQNELFYPKEELEETEQE